MLENRVGFQKAHSFQVHRCPNTITLHYFGRAAVHGKIVTCDSSQPCMTLRKLSGQCRGKLSRAALRYTPRLSSVSQ